LAFSLARDSRNGPEIDRAENTSTERPADPLDAELAQLIDAWPTLPAALRAGILAMIDAACKHG
jgi:hypothetical protein